MYKVVDNTSPWLKLFALCVVGGVAKALFAPTVVRIEETTQETVKDDSES